MLNTVTELFSLKGDHLVQPPRASEKGLSHWVLNVSMEGDSTISLGSLCQCLTTLLGKKRIVFFCSDGHLNHLVPIVSCPVSGRCWQEFGSPFS